MVHFAITNSHRGILLCESCSCRQSRHVPARDLRNRRHLRTHQDLQQPEHFTRLQAALSPQRHVRIPSLSPSSTEFIPSNDGVPNQLEDDGVSPLGTTPQASQTPNFDQDKGWLENLRQGIVRAGPWLISGSYLFGMLILPVIALLSKAAVIPPAEFWRIATEPVALSAYYVTLSMAVCATFFNGLFGFILAWVLSRYEFPGKQVMDSAVDLPFALPTAVAGLALATVYSSQGWIGRWFAKAGFELIFTRAAVFLAMVFVSFPFVVRSLQPVMAEQDIVYEEVSYSLGASPWQTFRRVVFPPLLPALLTGMTLSFSRALGEYGSIVIVAANIPLKDLVAPVLIFQNLEQYEYQAATVIGTVALTASLVLLFAVNLLQAWTKRAGPN